jgi:hypothetical protein
VVWCDERGVHESSSARGAFGGVLWRVLTILGADFSASVEGTMLFVEKLKVLQCKCFAAGYDFITADNEAILFCSRIHKLALRSSLGTCNCFAIMDWIVKCICGVGRAWSRIVQWERCMVVQCV